MDSAGLPGSGFGQPTRLERLLDGVARAAILIQIGWLLLTWQDLPERVPTHFDLRGQPDAWGGKGHLWILPGVQLWIYGLTALVLRLPPSMWSFPVAVTSENREPLVRLTRLMARTVRAELCVSVGFLAWEAVRVAEGAQSMTGWSTLLVLGVLFGTLAFFLVQTLKYRPKRGGSERQTPEDPKGT